MREFSIASNEAGQRFDKYLHKLLPEAGSGFLYKMLRKKNITLNGGRAEGREMLQIGDTVKIFFSEETFDKFAGTQTQDGGSGLAAVCRQIYRNCEASGRPTVLMETDDVLVLNKPVGMLTQKAEPGDVSLNEWMIGYLLESGQIPERTLATFHPSVCNRLDRNTSGVVLCGKSLAGSRLLGVLLKEGRIGKFYRCVVKGAVTQARTFEGYLNKDAGINYASVSSTPKPGASFIRSAYRPIQVYGRGVGAVTYLEIKLMTGKTHQIRAHLSFIGHPVLGDFKYGDQTANRRWQTKAGVKSQVLHAYRVEFPQSFDGLADKDAQISRPLAGQSIVAPEPAVFEKIFEQF